MTREVVTAEELGIPAGQVQVKDGVVHLRGQLGSPAEARLVALCVRVLDGVVHLRGQLGSPAEARLVALCVRVLDGVVAVETEELEPHPEAGS